MHRVFFKIIDIHLWTKESLFHIEKISPNLIWGWSTRKLCCLCGFLWGHLQEITRAHAECKQLDLILTWQLSSRPAWLGYPESGFLPEDCCYCRGMHTSHHVITMVTASPGPCTASCIDSFVDISIHSRVVMVLMCLPIPTHLLLATMGTSSL